jgi:glycosyltransferase involved in cell wall biosynthesis
VKIVYANNHLYRRGGSERVMFDEAALVARRGHETLFFGHRHPSMNTAAYAELFPEPVDPGSVRGLSKVLMAGRIVMNPGAASRFGRLLDLSRPDLVHAHNIYAGLTPRILDEATARGVPSVLTLHDYKLACPSYLMLCRGQVCDACVGGTFAHCLLRRCHKDSYFVSAVTMVEATFNALTGKWQQARFLICPSKFVRNTMIRHGLPAEKLRHVPNGIDLNEWSCGPADGGYLLYVGRISPEKGVDTLVRASVRSPLPLRIVGDGPDRPRLEALAAKLGAAVHFEGQKDAPAVRALLHGAAALLVPSVCNENAPITIVEAMASGKAVVASNIGGIPEMVQDGETGLLVTPGDVESLRHAIATVVANAAGREQMGRAGRERAEREFSLEHHVERIFRVYEDALA